MHGIQKLLNISKRPSFSPGWSMSSSGSNLVTKWLHLSSSEISLGNQATEIKTDLSIRFERSVFFADDCDGCQLLL